jgi:hypothetical protein
VLLSVVLLLAGALLVVGGVVWVSVPAAMITVGAGLVAYALYRDSDGPAE